MVAPAAISVSAPGSLMLLGEHAVLHGHRALVCAINRRIHVRLSPVGNDEVRIYSSLGSYSSRLGELAESASLRFAVQAIRQHAEHLETGFELEIESGFSADIGFGSSAAVTVAVHAALSCLRSGELFSKAALFEEALKTVRAVQGRGSGADVAASVFGGIVEYTIAPSFRAIPVTLPLVAVYCGYKTPTPEVIRVVEQQRALYPVGFAKIYREMDAGVASAAECLARGDMKGFGRILNRNQFLMDEMGVNTPELQEIVDAVRRAPGIYGVKISGSGLGDCAVGVGTFADDKLDYPTYRLETEPLGVAIHD